jgi:two-component system alkaline phosphatase synthesis response regulator PhoP
MSAPLPILIVEDERAMREGLRDNLEFEGYLVDEAPDGEAGLQKLLTRAYRLVLLDVMMPKRSGFEVLRETRNAGIRTPVIMLTAKGEEIDAVRGLEFGADDYVTKPFGLGELMARVKAVLRRTERATSPAGSVVEVGRLRLDLSTYEATVDGETVPMTHLEAEVLRHFAAHPGEVVSRDQLLDEVWGPDTAPTARTVDNFILTLRQKAETDPSSPRHFLTVHGVGYKFLP